jgi:hypothetical protein
MNLFKELGDALKPETEESKIYSHLNSLPNSEIWRLHTTNKYIRVGTPISMVSMEVKVIADLLGLDVVKFSHVITGLAIDYRDQIN